MQKVKYLFYLPLIVYAILIFIMSSISKPLMPDLGFELQDKLLHAMAFGLFGVLAQIAVYKHLNGAKGWIFISFFLCVLYAGTDEIHQYFVAGRFCDIWDFAADSLGILLVHLIGKNSIERFIKTDPRIV